MKKGRREYVLQKFSECLGRKYIDEVANRLGY